MVSSTLKYSVPMNFPVHSISSFLLSHPLEGHLEAPFRLDALVRIVTDILWSGSSRVRRWRGGDVRWLYYTLLGMMMIWGLTALHLATPIFLFQITANIGGLVTALASLHVLYVNRVLLPPELRPSVWRQITLVLCAAFYGAFVFLGIKQMVG